MSVLPEEIEKRITDHLKTLEMESANWLHNKVILSWKERDDITFFGVPFLEVTLDSGDQLEFSYKQSEGTWYCECDENNNAYNKIHSCCGNICDWVIPMITKHSPNGSEEVCVFSGKQKELWSR